MKNQKASTLVLVMLILLLFMGLIIGFLFESRAQSNLNAGIKLHSFYRVSGDSILENVRAGLADYWIEPTNTFEDISSDPSSLPTWRFGSLLQGDFTAGISGPYGLLLQSDQYYQNSGLTPIYYDVWVANNPDDPAFSMTGFYIHGEEGDADALQVASDWDTDGRIVLTVEIFDSDSATVPVAVISHMVGVSGSEVVQRGNEIGQEGSDTGSSNTGDGSIGGYEGEWEINDETTNVDVGAVSGGVGP